jgi:hydroxymethylpyrimidine pyrophosphatase-like HAD family hydrolase
MSHAYWHGGGRPQPYAEAVAQIIDTTDPLIFENGSAIFYPATGQLDMVVAPEQLTAITQITQALQTYCRDRKGCALEPGKMLSASLSGPAITELSPAKIGCVMAELASQFATAPVEWAYSNTAVDVTAAGINKWTACQRLIALDETSPTECGAIGDSNGDLCMLREVGQPMCPNNATDDVQALACFIAPQPHAAGFLDILDHLASS